ncbi:MAG: hypothetical protein AAGJ97_14885, partial [Planctomycetota bacterium]
RQDAVDHRGRLGRRTDRQRRRVGGCHTEVLRAERHLTKAFLVEGEDEIREVSFRPEDFGVAAADPSTLAVGSPAESAAVINGVLAGDPGPARDIVVANAAVALMVARGTFDRPADAAAEAAEAITDGRAADRLEALVEATARG